jgi:hypothetical protein
LSRASGPVIHRPDDGKPTSLKKKSEKKGRGFLMALPLEHLLVGGPHYPTIEKDSRGPFFGILQ